MAKDDLDGASAYFAAAANRFDQHASKQHPRYAEALTYQARVAALQNKTQQARRLLQDAEKRVYERVCRDLASSGSTRDRIAIVQEARVHPESIAWPGTIDTYLELAPELAIAPAEQYDVVLRWKGLIQRFDRHRDAKGPREKQLEGQLRKALFRKSVPRSKRLAWREEIAGYENQLREIRRAARQSRDSEAAAVAIRVADITSKLQPRDLFLDIFQFRTFRTPTQQQAVGSEQKYVAFAALADGRVARLDLGPADLLDAAVVSWCSTITERQHQLSDKELDDHHSRLRAAAEAAARLIQKPVLETDESMLRLLVRGDGATHLIPWAALPGVGGKQFWIENIRIQICDAAGPSRLRCANANPSLLAVGGVDFGELRYNPLSGSLQEQQVVRGLFQTRFPTAPASDLSGADADEATLMDRMVGKDFIHLATHGFYRRGDSNSFAVAGSSSLLQTGLVVAPAGNESRRDQYLTAGEIGEIDLSATSLVTLSACKSSLGQALAGQGVQGMFGSFHAAGAANVIGTLWEIDDKATVKMAERLYHHLWTNDLPPADALRAAQIDLIGTPEGDRDAAILTHPYAWAAFICSAN